MCAPGIELVTWMERNGRLYSHIAPVNLNDSRTSSLSRNYHQRGDSSIPGEEKANLDQRVAYHLDFILSPITLCPRDMAGPRAQMLRRSI